VLQEEASLARPRVFVSSTYYDLKHLRSSLENFVESLGFDAILSEKGQIAYTPEVPLDESCYREVGNANVFVLIVGGRYGSEGSQSKHSATKTFYDRYNSVTKGEYQSALKKDIPMYVLVERGVYAEYQTYLQNKDNKTIKYFHVDSVNVFELIEDILGQSRNNPVQQFEKYSEIEAWLREQWAGLFRELLQRSQEQKQLATLQSQVGQLAELNTTFKAYLEEIVSKIAPGKSKQLISKETKRLQAATVDRHILDNALGRYLMKDLKFSPALIRDAIMAPNLSSFERVLMEAAGEERDKIDRAASLLKSTVIGDVIEDVNRIRAVLGFPPLSLNEQKSGRRTQATE
jgi:hypothetical protein